jgi:site-specific recombinase XerD
VKPDYLRGRIFGFSIISKSAWIEDFPGSKPTIKQKLAAVRMLYDFLVVRQNMPSNPAHSVCGPKYVVKKGKTPVWSR